MYFSTRDGSSPSRPMMIILLILLFLYAFCPFKRRRRKRKGQEIKEKIARKKVIKRIRNEERKANPAPGPM